MLLKVYELEYSEAMCRGRGSMLQGAHVRGRAVDRDPVYLYIDRSGTLIVESLSIKHITG